MRGEVDAAVVAQLSESQADLGVVPETLRPTALDELVTGARLRVRGFSTPVVLLRRDASSAEVQAGPLRMKVPLAEITAIVADEPAKAAADGAEKRPGAAGGGSAASSATRTSARPSGITVHAAAASEDAASPDEINVIGCTVEEATRLVDKFIDTAALSGKPQVRIIHGHGTGALRRGLAEFFAAHPLVERIHAEADDRGGSAITVVELEGLIAARRPAAALLRARG